jgi:Zn-dependent protease with chaperone function
MPAPITPQPAEPEAGANQSQIDQQVLGAFDGAIKPVRVPITYRFGILLVSLVMILLPLIYVAVIGLACYGVYYHATHHTAIVGAAGGGRGSFMALLVYVAPMVIGAIMIVFMIKPLFARPARDRRTRSMTRDGEPLLFAFVDRLCEIVRAPRPKRIDVDCEINASASFRSGFFSMLRGNDLVLTVGIPLVAGLSARQFAGVLAHEFGHFSQGAGMRLTYIIRSISGWFTRVVYERDSWDEWLVAASQQIDLRIGWILYLARLCVWLTRWILWGLMLVGHGVASFMLRQMEFDADRYEARLAGSDAFESTVRRLLELNFANQWPQQDLGAFYREGRLGDNLPKLIMANIDQLPAELNEKIDGIIGESETGLFDTHPADKDRIASAKAENAPGIFRIGEPASVLFRHFEALSKNVTWDFYRGIFGPEFQPHQMHSVDDLLQRQSKEREANEALTRYFQGAVTGWRFVRMPAGQLTPPSNPKQVADQLKLARRRVLEISNGYKQTSDSFREADHQFVEAVQADAIHGARGDVAPADFSTNLSESINVSRVQRSTGAKKQQLAIELEAFEASAGQRLFSALQLLHVQQVAQRVDDLAAHVQQCNKMMPVLNAMCQHHHDALALRDSQAALAAMCGKLDENSDNDWFLSKVREQMDNVYAALGQLRKPLAEVVYPYDHAHGAMTVNSYLLKDMPLPNDLGALFDAAEEAIDKYISLYVRLLGSLALIAEKVETALGLPRAEAPEDTKV